MRSLVHWPVWALAIASIACSPGEKPETDLCRGKCDSADELFERIEGHNDPIAKWLRSVEVSDKGVVDADYLTIIQGIAETQGCDEDSIRTFVIADDLITDGETFPRPISTVCNGDISKSDEFYIAASFELFVGLGTRTGEIDTRAIEMFAWDDDARAFRFYATEPVSDDPSSGVRLEVEPARCRGCHLTPTDIAADGMHMLPIMNELTQPWSHWNAEPGFPSHDFEIPSEVRESESFVKIVEPFLDSASNFEQIVRTGQQRVVGTRLRRTRTSPPDLAEIMTLVRPLFCDEQVNYISEDFESGIVLNHAFVDEGIRHMFLQVSTSWPWQWANQKTARMPTPEEGEVVSQIPVRGAANVEYERQLVARRGLTAMQALRIRALDWQTPTLSDFRCDLWRDALERFESDPPDLGDAERNRDAISTVVEAILVLDGEVALAPANGDEVIALPLATKSAVSDLAEALRADRLSSTDCADDGFCSLSLGDWGDTIDSYIDSITGDSDPRAWLRQQRDERICKVLKTVEPADERFSADDLPIRFANRPSLPKVRCR